MEQKKILHKDINHFSKTAFSTPILPLNKKCCRIFIFNRSLVFFQIKKIIIPSKTSNLYLVAP